MKKLLALIFALAAAPSLFAGLDAEQFRQNLKSVKAFSSEFLQTRKIAALDGTYVLKGILQVDGGNMRFSIREPFSSDMYFIDGKTRVFEDGREISSGLEAGAVLEEIRAVVSGRYGGKYSEKISGEKIILEPVSSGAKSVISRIEITPSEDLKRPSLIEILFQNSDSTSIKFLNFDPSFGGGIKIEKK